jgi:glycine cleavage system transcriptional repressor
MLSPRSPVYGGGTLTPVKWAVNPHDLVDHEAMTTDNYLVLSALGSDRPGLVAEVTEYLSARGANIEDSRMVVLGAQFGILVLVSGPPEAIDRIEQDAKALEERTQTGILVRRTKSPEEHRRAAVIPCVITAEALDHEGIVRAVALAISKMGINIVSLETTAYNAPITGSPLFRLEATIDLPRGVSVGEVRKQMDEVARAENLDLSVRSLV